jgi:hypothetical protein
MTLWDAGPLIALINLHDEDHDACDLALRGLEGRAITTEAVITEAHYVLEQVPEAPRLLLELLDEWDIEVVLPDFDLRLRQMELMAKYRDAPMDYADATLVAAAERLGVRRIFTLDRRHFLMYRLHDRGSFELVPQA